MISGVYLEVKKIDLKMGWFALSSICIYRTRCLYDHIGTKTLHHLAHSKKSVKIMIISDNTARPRLRLTEYNDFVTENPGRSITFLQSMHRAHDRYIVLDEGTKDMKVYHCGASSKDAGKRITTITRIIYVDDYKATIKALLGNPALILK